MNSLYSASLRGREIYDTVWRTVQSTFWDANRLADWDSWAGKFDDQIVDEESALRFIDEMLASLNDPYTERVKPEDTPAAGGQDRPKEDAPRDVMAVVTKDNIGYLRIASFDKDEVAEVVSRVVPGLAGCDAIMLDLRHNSGGKLHLAIECLCYFIKNGLIGTIESRDWKRQYFVNGTQFFCVETLSDGTEKTELYPVRPLPLLAGKPLIVIIDGRTASAGEFMTASCVQNGVPGKTLIVGKGETPAKGIGQAIYELCDGRVKIKVTRTRWLCPGGEWLGDCGQTERNGIAPDVAVEDDSENQSLKLAADELRKMLGRDVD